MKWTTERPTQPGRYLAITNPSADSTKIDRCELRDGVLMRDGAPWEPLPTTWFWDPTKPEG